MPSLTADSTQLLVHAFEDRFALNMTIASASENLGLSIRASAS